MERYYRSIEHRSSPYPQPTRELGQDYLYGSVTTRYPNMPSIDTLQQPIPRAYDNMVSANPQYYLQPSIHECPTPNFYNPVGVQYFPDYAQQNKESNEYVHRGYENTYESTSRTQDYDARNERAHSPLIDVAAVDPDLPNIPVDYTTTGSVPPAQTTIGNQNAVKFNQPSKSSTSTIQSSASTSSYVHRTTTTTTLTQPNNTRKTANNDQKNIRSSGMRLFAGSVGNVMKWYKSLREIDGVAMIFEVFGRCLKVRQGCGCEKILLLRDASSGPVLQVTYYEIDFLLPEIRPGSTIKVVGNMVGTNRMQAYKIRAVNPSEGGYLPRLSAISQHIVTKLQATK